VTGGELFDKIVRQFLSLQWASEGLSRAYYLGLYLTLLLCFYCY